jgi:putative transposase
MWYNENMDIRKDPLVNDCYYHVFSRSIAKYLIFNDEDDFLRMIELFNLYRFSNFSYRYSMYSQLKPEIKKAVLERLKIENDVYVEIIANCVMPTHIHLILKQITDNGISKFMAKVLNSYARYFNLKHHRTGHLWERKFESVIVLKDEQLLHATRYVHLNATSAGLVKRPEDWFYSSYNQYIQGDEDGLCKYQDLIDLSPAQYKKFTNDRKSYQQTLSLIKHILIDDYSR